MTIKAKIPNVVALAVIGTVAATSTHAAELTWRQEIVTLDTARKVIDAAQEFAQKSGWPAVIAVTDPAGAVIAMVRMDGALVPAGTIVAPGKARTAALFAKPSGDLEKAINGSRPAAITAGDFVMMQGACRSNWMAKLSARSEFPRTLPTMIWQLQKRAQQFWRNSCSPSAGRSTFSIRSTIPVNAPISRFAKLGHSDRHDELPCPLCALLKNHLGARA